MSLLQNDRSAGSWFRATASVAVLLAASSRGFARLPSPKPRGRVLIVRGIFTVFSLGLDELGKKLRKQGLDVTVTAASGSSSAAAKIRDAYRRDPSAGPIVLIGHSLGGKLAPRLAREMQRYGVPVKLVLILDAPERMSIPSNVERCVNIYQSIPTGVVRGLPAHAESRSTEMVNIDIARYRGLSVNHFNIDGSDWIHDAVIQEVVRNCLPTNPATPPAEIVVTPKKQPVTIPRRQVAEALKKPPAATPKPPVKTTEKEVATAPKKQPAATTEKPPVVTLKRPPATPDEEVLTAPKMLPALTTEKQLAIDTREHSVAPPKQQPTTAKKKLPAATVEGKTAGAPKIAADAPGKATAEAPRDETKAPLLVPWPAFDVERRSIVSRIVR